MHKFAVYSIFVYLVLNISYVVYGTVLCGVCLWLGHNELQPINLVAHFHFGDEVILGYAGSSDHFDDLSQYKVTSSYNV